jgi:hypothetical protein
LIAGRLSFFGVFSSSGSRATAGTRFPDASVFASFRSGSTASTSAHRFRNAASRSCFFASSSGDVFGSLAASDRRGEIPGAVGEHGGVIDLVGGAELE